MLSSPKPQDFISLLWVSAHSFAVRSTAFFRAMPSVLLGRPRPPLFW